MAFQLRRCDRTGRAGGKAARQLGATRPKFEQAAQFVGGQELNQLTLKFAPQRLAGCGLSRLEVVGRPRLAGSGSIRNPSHSRQASPSVAGLGPEGEYIVITREKSRKQQLSVRVGVSGKTGKRWVGSHNAPGITQVPLLMFCTNRVEAHDLIAACN